MTRHQVPAHEHIGSGNSTQINNAYCPFPSSSSSLPAPPLPSPPPPPPSSAHGRLILDDTSTCLSFLNSIDPPLITATSDALQLEYYVPPLQGSPFHPDTNPQPPFFASSEFTPDDQDYKLYIPDTDEEFMENFLDGLQCSESCESLNVMIVDGQSYSQNDGICLPHATSLSPNLDSCFPATMWDNTSNLASPQIPAKYVDQVTDLKCFNQEDAISWTPGWSSPAASNATHGYHVGKEATDECIISDLIGDMPEQIDNLYDDRGTYTVQISVNAGKLCLDDGYRWRKYGRKKIKSNGDHPRDYLKCAREGCPVRKRAELSSEREGYTIFTYQHRHNHHPYH